MSFLFASSHLPETRVQHPEEWEDEDEDVQPMPRAGGVRAFSHLPQPVRAQADFDGPLSTRPATPVGRTRPHTEPDDDQDTGLAPESDSDHEYDTRAHDDYADDTPWHSPRITAQDQPPQYRAEDTHVQEGRNRTDPSTLRSSGFTPSQQDLRDTFHSPAPDSPTREAPAQDNASALSQGLPFGRHLPPGLRDQRTGQPQGFAGKAEYHDLVYSPRSNPDKEEQDHREGFFQNVADTRASRQPPSSAQALKPFAQNVMPATQAPASKLPTTQNAAPQRPPPAGQPSGLPLTPEDLKELYTDEGEERKPIGQLGIKGGQGLDRDGRPKTVCLYDGNDEKNKAVNGKNTADSAAFQQAAQDYASYPDWAINISLPNWENHLRAIQKILEGQGAKQDPSKGIDRIMIFDHGGSGHQEFGNSFDTKTGKRVKNFLTPGSSAWQTISSCIKPGGDIVLMGCETGKEGWDKTKKDEAHPNGVLMPDDDGPSYLDALYYAANASRSPNIHAYDVNVRLRTYKERPGVTAGRQISRTNEGFHTEGPEKKAEASPP